MWDPGADLFRAGGLHVCTPLSFFGLSGWKSSFTLIPNSICILVAVLTTVLFNQ